MPGTTNYRDQIEAMPAVETIRNAARDFRAEIIRQMYRLCVWMGLSISLLLLLAPFAQFGFATSASVLAVSLVTSLTVVTRKLLKALSGAESNVLEKVSERELLYFDLYDASPDLLLSVDSATGKILQCNRTLLKVLGYTKDEIVGSPILSFYHPDVHAFVGDLFNQFRRTGIIENAELLVRKKDGSYLDVSLNSSAVRNDDGTILYSRSSWRDVSKRKAAEKELRVLIETLPEFVWSCLPNGELNFVNQRWLDYTGCRPKVDSYIDVIHPDDRQRIIEEWSKALNDTQPYESELRLRNQFDGSYRWFLVRALPVLESNGQVRNWFGVSVDIEEMKRAKDEQIRAAIRERSASESSRLKSEFLAVVSHEIRTPLNGICGMTELLLRSQLSQKQTDYAQTIHQSSEVLLALINDILDFSKIESGHLEIEKTEFDPRLLIVSLRKEHLWKAQEKGLEFEFAGFENLPAGLIGDPLRLRQILTNLISNALKFTDQGKVKVSVESHDDSNLISFIVEDTGIGIEQSQIERLFRPFSQLDSSPARNFGGTGLGLSICKKLAEAMGGNIQVTSVVGEGARFVFTAPFERVMGEFAPIDLRDPGRPLPSPPSSQVPSRMERVLIVDDIPLNRKVIELYLGQLGFQTHSVSSGDEAIDALQTASFDLILLDCHMPGKDGYATAEAVRNLPESFMNSLPIIAVTASTSTGAIEKCLASGMNDYLAKPIKLKQLEEKTMTWIDHSTVDWNVFSDLEKIDPSSFRSTAQEFVQLFERASPERLQAIAQALDTGDCDIVHRATHALKSGSSYVGAVRLANLCDWIHYAVKCELNVDKLELTGKLVFEVQRVLALLHEKFD